MPFASIVRWLTSDDILTPLVCHLGFRLLAGDEQCDGTIRPSGTPDPPPPNLTHSGTRRHALRRPGNRKSEYSRGPHCAAPNERVLVKISRKRRHLRDFCLGRAKPRM